MLSASNAVILELEIRC